MKAAASSNTTDSAQHNRPVTMHGLMAGMQPAFMHAITGESHLAQLETGAPADEFCFDGLPEEWIVERDSLGNAIALHPDIIAGYWRNAQFFELSQLICMPHDD